MLDSEQDINPEVFSQFYISSNPLYTIQTTSIAMANPNLFKVAVAVMSASISLGIQAIPTWANDYWFNVINRSSTPIREIWVSEDGEEWQYFDLNGSSIPPNGSMELVWDESTNSAGCVWWIQATYSDGSESEAAQFDFCSNPDLVLTD